MFDAVRKFILALQELDVGKQVQKFPSLSCDSGLAKGSDGTSLINYMKSVRISEPFFFLRTLFNLTIQKCLKLRKFPFLEVFKHSV